MKSFFAIAALVASAAAQFTINTPSGATAAIQCQVYQVSWNGGTGPFDLRLLDASQNLVEELGTGINASPFSWTVNEPAGQLFGFALIDSQGNTALSGQFTIQTSSNSACLSSTPVASGGSSTTAAAGSSTAAGSSATTTAPASSVSSGSSASSGSSGSSGSSSKAAGSSSKPAGSSSASGSAASASNTASSALNLVANTGAFGAVFAAVAALF